MLAISGLNAKIDTKIDALDKKIDALDKKINALDNKFDAKIDALDKRLANIETDVRIIREQTASNTESISLLRNAGKTPTA